MANIKTVADLEAVAAQLKELEETLRSSQELALRLIAEKTKEANAAIKEAQRIAVLAGVEFYFQVGSSGVGINFNGEDDRWQTSSMYC